MTVEDDYKEILDGTVDEVKSRIREEEDLDYELLLELEQNGDDRKTIKTFVESRITEDDEEEEAEAGEEEEQEVVSASSEGGFLSGVEPAQVLTGGVLIGLLIGLLAGAFAPVDVSQGASQAQITEDVKSLITSGGLNGTVRVSDFEERNGMYYLNITISQETVNGTVSQSQGAYVTKDGELLFPVRTVMGRQVSPIELQQQRTGNATR